MPHKAHYSKAMHKKWRERVLKKAGYICQECRRYGRLDKDGLPVAATTAHHIMPLEEYPEMAYKVRNGQALCEGCHNRKHPEKGGRYW